jgi:hypothetical protein
MSAPHHHPRGRLRLHFSHLKNRPDLLSSVTASLRAIAGVDAVEADPHSADMSIQYDQSAADTGRFWDDIEAALVAHSLHHNPRPLKRQARPGAP